MKAIVVGAGIGGLTTALMLHARGIGCEVYEQSAKIQELGVGINALPHAIRELAALGLLDRLDAVAIRTHELFYLNRFGQEVWHEPRGLEAGHDVPQFSIHRGRLQSVLLEAVIERIGAAHVHTGRRLVTFAQDEGGVTADFADATGAVVAHDRADVLIGCDGIHSVVRRTLFPDEGGPVWNKLVLWRGARDWPTYLTGRSMVIAGALASKMVVYPIAEGETPGTMLTNWAVIGRFPEGTPPPERENWSRIGRMEDLAPNCEGITIPQVDVHALIGATETFWEYPLTDRDPLPRWSHGRVTLLGDAAHPMYPVGSNGASQAIIDARVLADALTRAEHPMQALAEYDAERLPKTAEIVRANREGGPEGVIDAVERLAPAGFDDVERVMSHADREAIVRGYAKNAGYAPPIAKAG